MDRPEPPARPRSVMLIVADQLRADVTYHERYPYVQTPHLDRLRDESVNVPNTFVQYPICGPSRACIVTGRYPQQHGVLNNRCVLPPDERTMGHHFDDCGHDAVAFGKTHGQNPGFRRVPEPMPLRDTLGDDAWGFYRGQDMLSAATGATTHPSPLLGVFDRPPEEHYDHVVARQVDGYLRERDPERPFLAWVGLHTPHPPLFPPRHLADLYPAEEIELPDTSAEDPATKPRLQRGPGRYWRQTSPRVQREMIAAYLALVTHVDACVGELMTYLRDSGALEDTVVVFLSDHGEQLGDHGMIGKLDNLYDGSVRVPLMFRLPGGEHAGLELDHLVELTDLYPTICDLSGVGKPASLSGHTLAPLFANPEGRHREHVHAMVVAGRASSVAAVGSRHGATRGHMVRTERWKLAVYTDDLGELYDLDADPRESRNLFDDPARAAVRLELYQHIVEHLLTYTRAPSGYGYNLFPG